MRIHLVHGLEHRRPWSHRTATATQPEPPRVWVPDMGDELSFVERPRLGQSKCEELGGPAEPTEPVGRAPAAAAAAAAAACCHALQQLYAF